MADANWFWSDNGKQNGPVVGSAIARMVADGTLGADDLIWKEGMAEWVSVRSVPALVKYLKDPGTSAPYGVAAEPAYAPVAAGTYADAAPAPVGYYNPSGALPPRAALTLARHALPRGDIGDWPLDDLRVSQFDEALKLRKKIDSAASLFRLMVLIMAIADVCFIIAGVAGFLGGSGTAASAVAFGMLVIAVFSFGFTALYFFAWKATVRSHAWAPLTMGILYVIGGVLNLVQLALTASSAPSNASAAGAAIVGVIVVLILTGLFAYIAFNAYVAIPKYLRQPAWCQELLSKTSQK